MADVIAICCVVDVKPQRQMLLPLLCHEGRCYCLYLFFVAGVKLHFYYLLHVTSPEHGKCYCQVAVGMATVGW